MFKQRRVPAKARRKTYAWSGDGVGADYDEDGDEDGDEGDAAAFSYFTLAGSLAPLEGPAAGGTVVTVGGAGLPRSVVGRFNSTLTCRFESGNGSQSVGAELLGAELGGRRWCECEDAAPPSERQVA